MLVAALSACRTSAINSGCAEPEEELEADEEDIFQLEGQTEHLHVSHPGIAAGAVEAARGEGARGGFEGAVAGSRADNEAASSWSAVRTPSWL